MNALLAMVALMGLSFSGQGPGEEDLERVFQRGVEALIARRFDEGIAVFEKCLELQPGHPMAAHALACCYSLKGEIDLAFDWLAKRIEWDAPENLGLVWTDSDLGRLLADPRYQRMTHKAWELWEASGPRVPPIFIDWAGGHRLTVSSARFSPDGSKIATASDDAWGRVWDSATGELLTLLVGHRSKHGPCVWTDSGRTVLTGAADSTLRSWDARTGEMRRVLLGANCGVFSSGVLSPSSGLYASAGTQDLRVFDLETGVGQQLDCPAQVYGIGFSPDGNRYATASSDGITRLFDVRSHECLATDNSGSPVFNLAFTPDGSWIVTGGADGVVRWLDAHTLALARSFRAHAAEVNDVVFRPDGAEFLTTSVDRTAKVWNATDCSLRFTLSGHAHEISSGDYRADGERILTASGDGTARIWDDRDGELVLELGGQKAVQHRGLAFSPDAAQLVSFDDSGTREWDTTRGRELASSSPTDVVRLRNVRGGLPRVVPCRERSWGKERVEIQIDGAGAGVDAVILSPNRRFLYTADWDDRGRLWSAESGHLVRDLGPLSRDGDLTRKSSRWASANFSPDGALLATAQFEDGATHLWECTTGEEVMAIRGGYRWSNAVAFDPSGERLAVTRGDLSVEVWDTYSRERLHSFKASSWPKHLAFRPDGRVLATGNEAGDVQLWDLTLEKCFRVLQPLFLASVCGLAFSPDGKRLASATDDHRVMIWDVESGRLLGTIVPGDERNDWLAYAPSAHYHGTSHAIARARLVQGAISYPLSCFTAALESPEQVAASLAGQEVEPPKLPTPPSLVVASPLEHTSSVPERVVHVEALATEALAGLAGFEVVQDGAALPAELLAQATKLEDNERLARLDLRLPIPAGAAETQITLQAVSARGIKSRPASFVVRYEPPKRELYVLALGVADYADDKLDLACPVQDVDGLVQRFQAQEELFQAVHVERRIDREVTNAEVLRLREEFLLQAKPDDTLVVFVAGHGFRTDTGEYWFLTSDATPARPFGGIQRSTLESLVTWDKLHATKRVLLLDTCHSGAAFGTRGERGIAFQQSEVDTLLERSSGLYILAATSDDGFAREQAGNGLFTKALLDGLDGAADAGDFGDKDGTVGIDELMHFARYAVLERSEGRQKPTFPKVEGGENFPLARVPGVAEVR
jgi:WD40 repeat protein